MLSNDVWVSLILCFRCCPLFGACRRRRPSSSNGVLYSLQMNDRFREPSQQYRTPLRGFCWLSSNYRIFSCLLSILISLLPKRPGQTIGAETQLSQEIMPRCNKKDTNFISIIGNGLPRQVRAFNFVSRRHLSR